MKPGQLDNYEFMPDLRCCPTCGKLSNIALYKKYFLGKRVYMLKCNGYGCYDTNYVIAFSVRKCVLKWNKSCYKWMNNGWQCIEK